MNGVVVKSKQAIKLLLEVNFYVSVIVLIVGGLLSVSDRYSIFQFNQELYGALDNNLRIVMVYLALAESLILGYCCFRKNFQVMIPVGVFLILMTGSMQVYAEINSMTVDENFSLFFFYTGLSHILFGAMVLFAKASADKAMEDSGKLSN
jgi:hypothetical protein